MMKKFWALLLTSCLILTLAACGNQNANSSGTTPPEQQASQGEAPGQQASEGEAPFHIGIVTGTVSQSEDEQRGAEAMIAKYGDADSGGYIRHLNYPDNFMQEQETTIQQIASLADDPLMKVIVVNQSVPGTTAAFKQIREKNPDIILLAGNSQEDTAMIESAADFVADPDNTNRGYLIPLAAQKMGAKTFVHVSFPRHMSIELLSLRKDIMEATCEELGIKFVMETAPDPMSDVGIPGAQQFILEKMPAWVEKYGKDTAFFVTNDAHTEPTLKKVAELGAIFVEQDLPSPILGYPGAFGIDLKDAAGNWPEILKRVESAVDEKGGSGRMGTWAFSFGFTTTQALAEFGKQIAEGTMSKDSLEDLIKAYEIYTPDAAWNGSLYVDRVSGDSKDNHTMVYQDTYVFGEGYLGMTDVEIPDVYKLLEK